MHEPEEASRLLSCKSWTSLRSNYTDRHRCRANANATKPQVEPTVNDWRTPVLLQNTYDIP